MAEPSLSEITGIRGDANIAGGSAGGGADAAPVVFGEDPALKYLSQAAAAKGEYNKYLSEQYHQGITDYMKNLRDMDFSKVMDADHPELMKQYADLAGKVGDNMDVIGNPNIDRNRYAELAQQEAALRSRIAQSNSHNGVLTYNRAMLAANPGWNTADNQKRISDYINTPMDQRKDFLLQTPTNFDPLKVAKIAGEMAMQDTKKQSLSRDHNWINTTEGKTYNQEAYRRISRNLYNNTIVDGKPMIESFKESYNMLPEEMKKGTTQEDYLNHMIDLGMPANTVTSSEMQANPYGTLRMQQNFQAGENQKSRDFQLQMQKQQQEFTKQMQDEGSGKPKPITAGEAYARAVKMILTPGGSADLHTLQNVYGDNSKVKKNIMEQLPKDAATDNKNAVENADGTYSMKVGEKEVPKVEITGSDYDPRTNTVTIHRRDNETGKVMMDITRTADNAAFDMFRMAGDKELGFMSNGAALWGKKHLGTESFTPKQIIDYYDKIQNDQAQGTNNQPTKPTGGAKDIKPMSDQAYQDLLRKNGLLK